MTDVLNELLIYGWWKSHKTVERMWADIDVQDGSDI